MNNLLLTLCLLLSVTVFVACDQIDPTPGPGPVPGPGTTEFVVKGTHITIAGTVTEASVAGARDIEGALKAVVEAGEM
jgi:hypothetical protein